MSIIPYKTKDSTPVASFFREIFRELGWEERDSDHMDKPHLLFHLPDKGTLFIVKEKDKLLGLKQLILDVAKDNPRAIRFYEKNGFIKTQVTPQEGWPESFTPETHYFFYKLI